MAKSALDRELDRINALFVHPFTRIKMRQHAFHMEALKNGGKSIHPYKPRGVSNTCAAPGSKARAIRGLTLHCMQHPKDQQSATHLGWLTRAGA